MGQFGVWAKFNQKNQSQHVDSTHKYSIKQTRDESISDQVWLHGFLILAENDPETWISINTFLCHVLFYFFHG